jgi:nucleoid DNA-binding protein
MDNKGRLIQEVARELGVPQKQVLEVVSSQTALARKAIQNKETTSVYLRQVGTFMSRGVRERMTALHKAQKLNRVTTTKTEEEPLRFD